MLYPIWDNIPKYMEELRSWIETQENVPLEEMGDFFATRIHDYEDHMML